MKAPQWLAAALLISSTSAQDIPAARPQWEFVLPSSIQSIEWLLPDGNGGCVFTSIADLKAGAQEFRLHWLTNRRILRSSGPRVVSEFGLLRVSKNSVYVRETTDSGTTIKQIRFTLRNGAFEEAVLPDDARLFYNETATDRNGVFVVLRPPPEFKPTKIQRYRP